MTMLSWVDFTLSFVMVAIATYYLLYGRKLYRGLIILNLAVSVQFATAYILVVLDHCCLDIFSKQNVAEFLIKPLLGGMGVTILVNTFFLGRRNDH